MAGLDCRVGKGALAPCPPFKLGASHGGHAALCPPYGPLVWGLQNESPTLRTGRHRRGASVQPLLLADSDGAGALLDPVALHREADDRAARLGEGAGTAAR